MYEKLGCSKISICVKSKHRCSLEDEDNLNATAYLGAASYCETANAWSHQLSIQWSA